MPECIADAVPLLASGLTFGVAAAEVALVSVLMAIRQRFQLSRPVVKDSRLQRSLQNGSRAALPDWGQGAEGNQRCTE
jgi:hypothetical protein